MPLKDAVARVQPADSTLVRAGLVAQHDEFALVWEGMHIHRKRNKTGLTRNELSACSGRRVQTKLSGLELLGKSQEEVATDTEAHEGQQPLRPALQLANWLV
jgi:hypothetical protein